jgi:hypothetical protein
MNLTDFVLRTIRNPYKLTVVLALPLVVLLFVLLGTLLVFQIRSHKQNMELQLRESAKAYYEQILITRLWNADHGGVYVEITGDTKPNPYLDDPERDIITMGGRRYTKINPAFMTRQIAALATKKGTYKFHITSLKPVNPDNRPDVWETGMLRSFEKGLGEGFEITDFEGNEYFRYMAPLYIEQQCLECHGKNGYNVGDIRGGLSISIPTAVIKSVYTSLQLQSALSMLVMGLVSVIIIVSIFWVFSRRLINGIQQEMEATRLKIAMQLAIAAAHELRQPMTAIHGFSEILRDKLKKGESAGREMDVIINQCNRMNRIIKKMLSISRYKTRVYDEHTEIFDLEIDESAVPDGTSEDKT